MAESDEETSYLAGENENEAKAIKHDFWDHHNPTNLILGLLGLSTILITAHLIAYFIRSATIMEMLGSNTAVHTPPGGQRKITIMMDTNYPPYAMWNTTIGSPDQLSGIGYDFALEMCKQCNLECTMVVDKWAQCWSDDLPGDALRNGNYDGCATYTNQYQRQWSLEFSHAFLAKNKPAGILSKMTGGNAKIPPKSDLKGFKICDVAGWAPTSKTLSYSQNDCVGGQLFKGYTIVTPPENGPDAAMKYLKEGKCDGIYMYADMIESRKVCDGQCGWDKSLYQGLGTEYAWIHTGVNEHMANGTTLTMSKKGSGIPELINGCIQSALQTQEYYSMCAKYHLEAECFPNQYFPKGVAPHFYAIDNLQRAAACTAGTESGKIIDQCKCQTGYCGCNEGR